MFSALGLALTRDTIKAQLQLQVETLQAQLTAETTAHSLTKTELTNLKKYPTLTLLSEKTAHETTTQNLSKLQAAYTSTLRSHGTAIQDLKAHLDLKEKALNAERAAHEFTKVRLLEKEVQCAKQVSRSRAREKGERSFEGLKAGYGSLQRKYEALKLERG